MRIFLEIQLQVAFVDGQVESEEPGALVCIAHRLGLSTERFERLEILLRWWYARGAGAAGKQDGLGVVYEALGVCEAVSDAEIKKAYRRLMNQHHPDNSRPMACRKRW
jgi:DnaJ like chaperone protein